MRLTLQSRYFRGGNLRVRDSGKTMHSVNRHSTVTHYQRPNMTHPQEGGTGGEVSEILFFSAKSKRRPSLIYSMQIIPVCLSIVARRKGVSATRRGGLYWTPISLLVGHPCKLFHTPTFSNHPNKGWLKLPSPDPQGQFTFSNHPNKGWLKPHDKKPAAGSSFSNHPNKGWLKPSHANRRRRNRNHPVQQEKKHPSAIRCIKSTTGRQPVPSESTKRISLPSPPDSSSSAVMRLPMRQGFIARK